MPRNMAADTIDFASYLQLSMDFFAAPDIIATAKRGGRKACGLTFPFPELILGGGAVPVFLPRLNRNKRHDVIQAAMTAQNTLGMTNIARSLEFLKRVDSTGTVLRIAGNMINDVILGLNETYETAVQESATLGMPVDHCYGAKALFGLYKKLGQHLDMNLGIDVRCSVFFNYHEALSINNFVGNNHVMDMPYSSGPEALQFFEEEIRRFIAMQEGVTGKRFDERRFADVLDLSNEAKRLLREFYLQICPRDVLPCSPGTLSEINSLLVYSQIDCNSRLQRYVESLRSLIQECWDRVDKPAKRFDATGMPKLLYTPMFGGFEPEVAMFAEEIGARVYYPDWLIFGAMEPVQTTGDVIGHYANNLLRFQHGFGLSNAEMNDNIINVATAMKIDGIIFCEVFGCRSMCTGHRLLRDMLRRRGIDIPVTVITFNNMGDSLGQVKTRVSALVEMIKER